MAKSYALDATVMSLADEGLSTDEIGKHYQEGIGCRARLTSILILAPDARTDDDIGGNTYRACRCKLWDYKPYFDRM